MKTVKIFGNDTEQTKVAIAELKVVIDKYGLILVEDKPFELELPHPGFVDSPIDQPYFLEGNAFTMDKAFSFRNIPDLAIAVGGDGAFLNMLHQLGFNPNILYVGVHTGHLGFLQEVDVKDMDKLIESVVNEDYNYEIVSVEDVEVYTKVLKDFHGGYEDMRSCSFKALNEISVKERNSKTVHLGIFIDDKQLEKFSGNEILVSTSTGSTAYNMSAGGSLIYPTINMLQITPVAPLNSKAYRSLNNSVIVPEHMVVTVVPEERYDDSLLVVVDGVNHKIDNISKIEVTAAKEGVKVIRFGEYDFWERINDKFL